MSYVGNTPTQQAFTPAVDFFNGNGSTVAFTLSRPVASVAQVQVVISNVPQKPGDAYTVSGNTITFTSAPPSGTSNIYVYYTSPITQVIQPGAGTVGTAQIQNGSVIPADLSTGAPTWDTSGNVTTTGTVNNLTVGRGAGSVATNTAVGASALAANTTGNNNTALGYQALSSNTIEVNNSAVGYQSLYLNTTGGGNSALGASALASNTTGNFNIAIGFRALQFNTTASNNTAVGYQAGYSSTTTANNTTIGYRAGYNNTGASNTLVGVNIGAVNVMSGSYNVALGDSALYSASSGANNTAVGYQAGYTNSTGTQNTFVGNAVGYANTTGSYNIGIGGEGFGTNTTLRFNTTGQANIAIGASALASITASSFNTAIGYQAGYSGTTSANNTLIGAYAGYSITTGTSNTFIGHRGGNTGAGDSVTTGSKNTILGGYNGNQGGLDIRTTNNVVVLSDGDGNLILHAQNNASLALQGAITQAGIGITFPATQSASSNANTLDDYEEGTWTPVWNGGTSSPSRCRYTKIGRLVTLQGTVDLGTNVNGGFFQLSGLPFGSSTSVEGTGSIMSSVYDFPTGCTMLTLYWYGGSNYLTIYGSGNNIGYSQTTNAQATNSTIIFTMTYEAS
jgi:hypothetical protein